MGFKARPCAILKFLHPVNTQNAGQAIVWGTIPDYVILTRLANPGPTPGPRAPNLTEECSQNSRGM